MSANKGSADSGIPVFSSNPKPLSRLSRPLANFSNKVRAHLTADAGSKHRQFFGILAGGGGKSTKSKVYLQQQQPLPVNPPEGPARPNRFVEGFVGASDGPRFNCDDIGRKVCVAGKTGVLRYLGKLDLDPGTWCGVELDEPVGQNDGSVRGVRYFDCQAPHGVLVPAVKVTLLPEEIVSEVSESGPHSVLVLPSQKRHSMGEEAPASVASTPTPSSSASAGALIWDWTLGSQHSSSAGSLVPSARALSNSVHDNSRVSLQLSKHSSFDFEDSLGILTPDQMADFLASNPTDATLTKTASTEEIPFLLQDFDYEKELGNRSSKRSSAEINLNDTQLAFSDSFTTISQIQPLTFDNIILRRGQSNLLNLEPIKDIVMTAESLSKDTTLKSFELMDQDTARELSADMAMCEGNRLKKTSTMCVSYGPSCETVSNTDNVDFVRNNRTSSLEDLPLDKGEGKHELTAGPSKHVMAPPTSFLTSVTSIASLDNGYQGDGEWSRPTSRGADHSPLAGKMATTLDPMTDSDFFTESDADMHDDSSAPTGSGTGRGDRKAQVIDGTLYGGVSGSAHQPPGTQVNPRCPAFTPNTEDMDSSGVYSDLDRKPEDIDAKSVGNENVIIEIEKDLSPEGSTRTGSSIKSELSQTLLSPAAFTSMMMDQVNTVRTLAVNVPMECSDSPGDAMEDDVFLNDSATAEAGDALSDKTVVEVKEPVAKTNEEGVKKYKMPKRNVVSKIKTMITSSQTNKKPKDENQENRRPERTQKKTGRWDAVMNKIAQAKEEEKTKPSRLKDVKSRVFAGITNVTPPGPAMPSSRQHLSARGQCLSTRSLGDVSSLKMKSRRSRPRGSECSLPAGQSPNSQPSSRNSSLSDVSLKVSTHPTRNKKRDGVRSGSPHSDVSPPAGRPQARPQKNGSAVCVAELKGSPVRKPAPRRPTIAAPAKTPSAKDLNRLNHTSKGEVVSRPPAQQPQVVCLQAAANKELSHAAQGVEALGVLLNYLVYNLDAFSTPQLKKDLDKMRGDWLSTKLQMEEMRMSYLRAEEDKGLCQRRLQELQAQLKAQSQNHSEQLLSMNKIYQEQVQDIEHKANTKLVEVERCHAEEVRELNEDHKQTVAALEAIAAERLAEIECKLTERLVAVQAECDSIKQQNQKFLEADKAGRYKILQDEIESLRVVLELRSAELQELRRTSELAIRDAQELPSALQRVSALQARVEDLEIQLSRKAAAEQALAAEKESMELKVQQEDSRYKRLSQYNEELMWKLKQNSEVFALIQKTPQATHLLASLTKPKHCHNDHLRNGESKDMETPKLKRVVEKSDSVSWVVDLEDSAETMMNRLVRRTHSLRTIQSATLSPCHNTTRTLPNPHKRQRRRTTCVSCLNNEPQRVRSFSFDSDTSEVPRKLAAEWDRSFSPSRYSPSPQSQMTGSNVDEMEDLIVVETVGEDPLTFFRLEQQVEKGNLKIMAEDFGSPNLSLTSGDSDLTIRRINDQSSVDSEDIFMLNRVDGLSFSLPKESAGEAMISEETSDNDSGARDSEEEGEIYCSDLESLSGSVSELETK